MKPLQHIRRPAIAPEINRDTLLALPKGGFITVHGPANRKLLRLLSNRVRGPILRRYQWHVRFLRDDPPPPKGIVITKVVLREDAE